MSDTRKIAVHQSQYLPWLPYLKKIALADEFVWMDCVQFQRRGVQNRNRIRNRQEDFWLTIPVSGLRTDRIMDMRLSEPKWRSKHWTSIQRSYAKAPLWNDYADSIEVLYRQDYANLDEVNWAFVGYFLDLFSIDTPLIRLSDLDVEGQKSGLILNICKARSADVYLSGTGAQDYLDQAAFNAAGIAIEYLASAPPDYRQFHGEFIAGLSVLDMLFNVDLETIRSYLPGRSIPPENPVMTSEKRCP